MTPKEKAKELVDKFSPLAKNWDCYNDEPLDENNAKQCALIAVDEIINAGKDVDEFSDSYWQQVKQEIEIEKL